MSVFINPMSEIEVVMNDFHEELYQLEEEYLKRFGVYPTMPDLAKDTMSYYVEKIQKCLLENQMMEDLEH